MAKSQQSWAKREREKQKQKAKQEKAERKAERKEQAGGAKSLDDMMAYIDENGNIVDTPPDPSQRKEVKLEDIVIGVPKREDPDPAELQRTGIITFFNEAKGFGFIRDLQSQESIFVHVNNMQDPAGESSRVTFEVEMSPKGPSAVNVRLAK